MREWNAVRDLWTMALTFLLIFSENKIIMAASLCSRDCVLEREKKRKKERERVLNRRSKF